MLSWSGGFSSVAVSTGLVCISRRHVVLLWGLFGCLQPRLTQLFTGIGLCTANAVYATTAAADVGERRRKLLFGINAASLTAGFADTMFLIIAVRGTASAARPFTLHSRLNAAEFLISCQAGTLARDAVVTVAKESRTNCTLILQHRKVSSTSCSFTPSTVHIVFNTMRAHHVERVVRRKGKYRMSPAENRDGA